jgi:hypothetical protein
MRVPLGLGLLLVDPIGTPLYIVQLSLWNALRVSNMVSEARVFLSCRQPPASSPSYWRSSPPPAMADRLLPPGAFPPPSLLPPWSKPHDSRPCVVLGGRRVSPVSSPDLPLVAQARPSLARPLPSPTPAGRVPPLLPSPRSGPYPSKRGCKQRDSNSHREDDTTSWGNFRLFLTHYSNVIPI